MIINKCMQAFVIVFVAFLAGCAVKPQVLKVEPELVFPALKGVAVPVKLFVEDNRSNDEILGYRNAKKEGPITLVGSLPKALGERIQSAMSVQGIKVVNAPDAAKVTLKIERLDYSSPDESWVSHIEMHAAVQIIVERGNATMKKRFAANRARDVATAPSEEFNQEYLNGILSELLNEAFNDREIAVFLK